MDVDLSVIDMRNTMADQIAQAAKVHLQTISGATHFQKEIGIKTYILSKLFTPKYPPPVEGYTCVVEWIDSNFKSFEQQVQTTTLYTSLAYNLSRVEVGYYNACICASTSTLLGDPGAWTPVSFQMLSDKLTWGQYIGQLLPATLQLLLLLANGQGRKTTTPQLPPPG